MAKLKLISVGDDRYQVLAEIPITSNINIEAMTDINKKFRMIIENEDLFKSNPEAMLRLKYLVDNKKSFKNITKEEIEALYIYLNRHNIANS